MWHATRIFAGLALVIAGCLKLFGTNGTYLPFLGSDWPFVSLLFPQLEVVLGCWLLIGWRAGEIRILAIAFYLLLGLFSLLLFTTGEKNCRCFGDTNLNPLFTFAWDVLMVILLSISSPTTHRGLQKQGASISPFVSIFVLLSIAIAFDGLLQIDNPVTNYVYVLFTSKSTVVQSRSVRLNNVAADSWHRVDVEIWNRGRGSVTVTGGTFNCGVNAIVGLPITVPPGARVLVPIFIKVGIQSGDIDRSFIVYLDDPSLTSTRGQITGFARVLTSVDR